MPAPLTIAEVDEMIRTAVRRMQTCAQVSLPDHAAAVQALATLRMSVAAPAWPTASAGPTQYVPLPWSVAPANNPTLR